MQFTQEHAEIRRTLRAIIDKDINPHVDQWEEDGIFPAHQVFKKLGDAGLLGINKPAEFGGMGLDYSYAMVMAEELGNIHCGSVPMAIGVQTDMAAPAPTSPRSRPRPSGSAATTSSTAARCGRPTARRPTGCACSPTPAKVPS